MRSSRSSSLIALAAAVAFVAACDSSPSEAESELERDLAIIEAATAQYQDFDRALADGFVPLSGCVASPAGGMGYHYGLPSRIGDGLIDPAEPEILLYEPLGSGQMRLVGVEFMAHSGVWYANGAQDPPSMAGRGFDPPNPQHPDEAIREFYTLHVWNWVENPDGLFAHFNPNVSCEEG